MKLDQIISIHAQKRFAFVFVLSLILTLGFSDLVHAGFSKQNFDSQDSRFSKLENVAELTVAQTQKELEAEPDIVETARAYGSLRTFMDLFRELGMEEDLRGYGRFTIFMPNDEAFVRVENELQNLRRDRGALATLLSYHIVASGQPIISEEINSSMSVQTLAGRDIVMTRRRGEICVGRDTEMTQHRRRACGNNAQIITADIEASNGVIHVIDKVLLP